MEIERIYVARVQRQRLGKLSVRKSFGYRHEAKEISCMAGCLGKNDPAIRFYQKHGFYVTGSHAFWLGDDEQTDHIMRKDM